MNMYEVLDLVLGNDNIYDVSYTSYECYFSVEFNDDDFDVVVLLGDDCLHLVWFDVCALNVLIDVVNEFFYNGDYGVCFTTIDFDGGLRDCLEVVF